MARPPVTQRAFGSRFILDGDAASTPLYDELDARDVEADVPVALWLPGPALFAQPVARDRLRRATAEMRAVVHPRLRRMFATGDAPGPWITYQPASRLQIAGVVASAQIAVWLDAIAGALFAIHAAGLVHGGVLAADVVALEGDLRLGGGGVWACADPRAVAEAVNRAGAPIAPERRRGGPATAAADAWGLAHLVATWAGGVDPDPLVAVAAHHRGLAAALAPVLAADPAARPTDLVGFVAAAGAALVTPFADERRPTPAPSGRRRRKKQTAEGHSSVDETTERTAPPAAPAAPEPVQIQAVSMKPGGPGAALAVPTPPAPTPQLKRPVIRAASPPIHQESSGAMGRLAPPRAVVEAERRTRRKLVVGAGIALAVVVAVLLAVLVGK
jgi:hypothetical protein